jgi:hypothetical protein
MNLRSSFFPLISIVALICLTLVVLALHRPGGIRASLRSRWVSLGVEIDPSPPVANPKPAPPASDHDP